MELDWDEDWDETQSLICIKNINKKKYKFVKDKKYTYYTKKGGYVLIDDYENEVWFSSRTLDFVTYNGKKSYIESYFIIEDKDELKELKKTRKEFINTFYNDH